MKKKFQPKFVAVVAMSLDGRIAPTEKTFSGTWTSKEDWNFFQSYLSKVHAVVVGHTTYKVAKERLDKRNTIVFTRDVSKPRHVGSVHFINPQKTSVVEYCEQNGFMHVAVLGGSEIYAYFFAKKIATELLLTIEPEMLFSGVPFVAPNKSKQISWQLKSIKKLNSRGTLFLRYINPR